jgi:hypothetical protein
MSAIERLLERLQTGWAPKTDEIDRDVPQRDLIKWEFAPSFSRPTTVVIGFTIDRAVIRSDEILWIDEYLTWALCEDGFWWLYTAEEGEKMRYLGG